MIQEILTSISLAINKEFGDDYTTYTESLEQGLKEPCFFVHCINSANRQFLGNRYFSENQICVQFFPTSNMKKEECNSVGERLYSCLEFVPDGDDLLHGTSMRYETVDGILNFFVNFDLFTKKVKDDTPMEDMSETLAVKG